MKIQNFRNFKFLNFSNCLKTWAIGLRIVAVSEQHDLVEIPTETAGICGCLIVIKLHKHIILKKKNVAYFKW